MSLDQEALDRASWELQRHFGREGSIYGIKACEEIARIAIVAYGLSPEGVAIMPELSTVEIQEAICDHMLGLEWRESSGRHKSRCRSDAADVYNAIRAYCLPQLQKGSDG